MDINDYKDKIASRYIPVDPEVIGMKITEADYYLLSAKLDGHLGLLVTSSGKPALYNRSGKVLDLPAITKAAAHLPPDLIFAGEICVFKNGKSGKNQDVAAALAAPDKHDIRFAVFDMIDPADQSPNKDLKSQYDDIKKIVGQSDTLFSIAQQVTDTRKDIISFYNDAIKEHEGIIVRSSNGAVYKIKPVITLDFVILGYAEGIGERQGMIRELLLGYAIDKNHYQIVTHCGNGFSEAEKKDILKKLSALWVESEYTEASTARIAFNMVRPEVVAEVSCLDISTENSGSVIRKAVVGYNEKSGYSNPGLRESVSLTAPVFKRIREDKTADSRDAGYDQLSSWLAEPVKVRDEKTVLSKIISKTVFTKKGKGGTAVRKFSIVKTNKEETGLYAPFVVVYTDFSGGRKTPLEQELYLCASAKDAENKVDELKIENIKKGWEPHTL